jgi:hypothetical protein
MSLYDLVMEDRRLTSLYERVFYEAGQFDNEYREKSFDLPEKMFMGAVKSGADLSGHADVEALHKFKAKKPKFIKLQQQGWVKHQAVLRSRMKEKTPAPAPKKKGKGKGQQEHPGYKGRSISIHYWEHPKTGERRHAKFTTHSPYLSRTD